MFQVRLGEIVTINGHGDCELNPRVGNVIRAKRLPVKVQYQLAKIGKRLEQEVRHCQETRFALIKELGAPVPAIAEGKEVPSDTWQVKAENAAEFGRKMVELLNLQIDIDLNTMTVADLGEQVEGTTSEDLMACLPFITEASERPTKGEG